MHTIQFGDYNIIVGDVWKPFHSLLEKKRFSKIVILVDENTKRDCLSIFEEQIAPRQINVIEIRSGEKFKNIETCQFIWKAMMDMQLDRNAVLVNLGGGVIGDMGGFCAATYKRGISFIQFPTSLLAQVDASIGGKLGIDLNALKNSIGLFKNPDAVFIDPIFLKTLPSIELKSGFAEMLKHGLIKEFQLWQLLKEVNIKTQSSWETLIYKSLLVKEDLVKKDPLEKGERKVLNFGHTIGHAIESWALENENPITHGEAIYIGMICESWLSNKIDTLSNEEHLEIYKVLLKYAPKMSIPKQAYPRLLSLMKQDKKNIGDQINFTLLKQIGQATFNQECTETAILESIAFFNQIIG